MFASYTKAFVLTAALLGLAGCASTSEIDTLRAEVQQANATAEKAMAEAASASREAAAASQTADEAKAIAQESDSRIDRMFKKSMYK